VPSVIPNPSLSNFPRPFGVSPRIDTSPHESIPLPNINARSTLGGAAQPSFEQQGIATPPVPSLLDEDTAIVQPVQRAPPRPPNPELLQLQARILDAERLRALQADLLAGEPAIRDEMARLEAVRDVCRNVSGRLRGTVNQAEKNIAELRRKGDPEVDEMVCATSIVHNQLINLVAEDNAIEDTIYQLHRALNAGGIDLERFLRTTRVLAEEQFMKRALIEKITIGAALTQYPGTGWS